MKIDNSLKPVATGANASKAPAPRVAPDSNAPPKSVQISALSTQLKAAESSMASAPAVNMAKVNQIKQAISEGRFKVNPEAISSKLINSVKELIQSNQQNA
ncbi:MAG: flagellar biosynthesis anti-sigma factor FlgM [Burkholderiales bacterium]